MALWANTADGWGSDPSKSGNGALGTYLQSSDASAPKSNSLGQAQDPANSMPTTSIARVVQPAASKLAYGSTGGLATPATALQAYTPTPLVTALSAPVAVAAPAAASRVQASIAPQPAASTAPATPVTNAVSYGGPSTIQGLVQAGAGYNSQYSVWNPATHQYELAGARDYRNGNFTKADGTILTGQAANAYVTQLSSGLQKFNNTGDSMQAALKAGQNSAAYGNQQYAQQIQAYSDGQTVADKTNQANLSAANNTSLQQTYLEYLSTHGTLPPRYQADNSLGGQDDAARAGALAEYQANQASASAITQGIAPVDTSTQDAENHASLAAISSRYSTNLMGSNIGAMGRLYANAIPDQAGTNKQLSDEDYAQRFNQNMSTFQQAVSNQANVDTDATGTKLQSDITALGDGIAKLNQQVTQLGSKASIAVGGQLNALQKQINTYTEAVARLGANNAYVVSLAKGIIGGVAAVTSLAS